MPKKPDFGQELDNGSEREVSPIPNFETLYGGLNLPDEMRALAESRGYHYAADGLDIQRELTGDDWRNILPEIKALHSSYQLIIGDWMVYGFEHGYVVSYEDMAILTGMQPQTIEVYTSICRNVPRLIRINPLKFSHYRLIAPLPEDERIVWIEFAAGHALSFRALQKLIDFAYLPRLPESTSPADIEQDEPDDDRPALSDEDYDQEAVDLDTETVDLTDAIYEKTVIGFRKKASQNRYAEIDLTEILRIETWLMTLRKKVAQAKVDAGRQARTVKK